jgi:hypothetical protein
MATVTTIPGRDRIAELHAALRYNLPSPLKCSMPLHARCKGHYCVIEKCRLWRKLHRPVQCRFDRGSHLPTHTQSSLTS